jgi:hypothetical protein
VDSSLFEEGTTMPSTTLAQNIFTLGKHHNYLVAGNICNAFVLGELDSQDDFFLVGAEPRDDTSRPLLTGHVLNSHGQLLFRLTRNILTLNPGHCIKTLDPQGGYEIHDRDGVQILKVTTRVEALPHSTVESLVTRISATFFGKSGNLVFKTHGEGQERIESGGKAAFGFDTVFGYVQGYTEDELDTAKAMLDSGGTVPS